MVEQKIIVLGLAVVLALGTLGFNWVESIMPTADAHGVQAQLQSRFINIFTFKIVGYFESKDFFRKWTVQYRS